MNFARFALAGAALLGAAFSAAVFEAAASTQAALELARSARTLPVGQARAQVLSRARETLEQSWARATLWHAGALEALSWIEALSGENEPLNRSYLSASARAAVRGLEAAPVQPIGWMRLAALAHAGETNPLCEERACVTLSFASAPMLEPVLACERLRIAQAAGFPLDIDHEAVSSYLATRPDAAAAAACLWFLSPDERFDALMRLRVLRANDRAVRNGDGPRS